MNIYHIFIIIVIFDQFDASNQKITGTNHQAKWKEHLI